MTERFVKQKAFVLKHPRAAGAEHKVFERGLGKTFFRKFSPKIQLPKALSIHSYLKFRSEGRSVSHLKASVLKGDYFPRERKSYSIAVFV